jgi:AraC-like DNA-binding protein
MRDSPADMPNKSPSAIGVVTRLACARAREEGIEVDSLLRKADLTQAQIDDPWSRLDVRSQIEFLELVAEALNDELLGFHLGQKYDLRMIGLLYYAQDSSDTVAEALRRGARYSSIVNEGIALRLSEAGDIRFNFDYVGVARNSDRHQIEFAMVSLVRICRQLSKRHLAATRVSFAHRRKDNAPEFKSFFGSDVALGASEDRLAFAPSIGQIPVVSADPYLNDLLLRYCEQALAARPARRGAFGLSVENAIALLLPHGNARADEIARKLGVSRRTLARRLSAEGLTFASVMRNLRSDLAKRHLADETLTISEIAWLLGYQDVSAFTHAFKRWTGKAPRATRQLAR